MKSYTVYQTTMAFKGRFILKFLAKMHYFRRSTQILKAAHPVIIFFFQILDKNIQNCPPSKLFLFTSLQPFKRQLPIPILLQMKVKPKLTQMCWLQALLYCHSKIEMVNTLLVLVLFYFQFSFALLFILQMKLGMRL